MECLHACGHLSSDRSSSAHKSTAANFLILLLTSRWYSALPPPPHHQQVVAEKLNFFRYLSHFRSVHRGAYFAELRTTTVRKLLPESWGFMCPVHTPDGAPCGLLNHFTAACRIVTHGPHNPEQTDAAIMQVRGTSNQA